MLGGDFIATAIKQVFPKDDYFLEIIMANGNSINCDMKPYLDTIQFCPLKKKDVWRNIEIQQSSIKWRGNSVVELSIDRLLDLFMKNKQDSREVAIKEATSERKWQLHLQLVNGNWMRMDLEQLLEYPLFTPLLDKGLWNTLQVKEHSLLWENQNVKFEVPLPTLLNYF